MQKPHPPILLGGHTAKTLQRVVDYCDGWMPIGARAGDLIAGIKELRGLAEAKGRDPRTISVSVFGAPPDEPAIRRYSDAGVERVVFGLPSAPRDTVLPMMDRYAELMRGLEGLGGLCPANT